ncbi:MAG: adenylate kinase [Dehalococcoidia bacterium]
MTSTIGTRIVLVGPTSSGKTTLADRLGTALGLPSTDLDALYWKPGWVGAEDDEWHPRLRALAAGEGWVVAGNYIRHTMPNLWPRAETIVWLDLPLRVVLPRVLRRSWRRSRSRELLWGTNVERFWPQLKFWDPKSLVGYAIQTRVRMRNHMVATMANPAFARVRFVRLRSPAEIEAFTRAIEGACHSPS